MWARSSDDQRKVDLASIGAEIDNQPEELAKLVSSPKRARRGSILVGAGDSYAASMIVSSLSSLRLLAADPRALSIDPEAARDRDVYFTSVSGRTTANIEAARKVRGLARRITVITADTGSPLAVEADEVISIPFRIVGKAPGILSFSLCLLTLILLEEEARSWDFRRALGAARVTAARISLSRLGTNYFLGNHAMYGIGVYAAAKVREFLGWRAYPVLLEEFPHMELFSLSPRDRVNILSTFDDDKEKADEKLSNLLMEAGYLSRLLPSRGDSRVEALFHATFSAQIAAVARAERAGFSRPYFLGAKKQLKISDAAIY
jgi:fructoselysine-6-P-deglycase FrlB-like protein